MKVSYDRYALTPVIEQAESTRDPKMLVAFLRNNEVDEVQKRTRADRCIVALREAADALDNMPLRRRNVLLGNTPVLNTQSMRDEAEWMERQRNAWQEIIDEPVADPE